MWPFTKKKRIEASRLFKGMTDYHSHILYGVDDGVERLEESLEVLAYYETLGVKRVLFTPHIQTTCKEWEKIEAHFATLQAHYGGGISLGLAAEYMLDSGFQQQLERGLRPIEGKRVLVESSYLNKTPYFDEMLYQMTNEGYIPVIAHPERYLFLSTKQYHQLKACDYQFQLNLLSLSGGYGTEVKRRALYLLTQGMVDVVGSDLHTLERFKRHLQRIEITEKEAALLPR